MTLELVRPYQGPFRARPENVGALHGWLKGLQQVSFPEAAGDTKPPAPLIEFGAVVVQDTLLYGVDTKLRYTSGTQDIHLDTDFTFAEHEEPKDPEPAGLVLPTHVVAERVAPPAIPGMGQLKVVLARELPQGQYRITVDKDGDLAITRLADKPGAQQSFVLLDLKSTPDVYRFRGAYTFRGISQAENSQELLERGLTEYGDLVTRITSALYTSRGMPVPETELVMENHNYDKLLESLRNKYGDKVAEMIEAKKAPVVKTEDDAGIDPDMFKLSELPDIHFDDLGGYEDVKTELETLVYAYANPDAARRHGLPPPRGAILYGPTGTGKTSFFMATANEAREATHDPDMPVYSLDLRELLTHWRDIKEARVANVFRQASQEERAFVFVDEMDAVVGNSEWHGENRKIFAVMAQALAGTSDRGNIVFFGTTNRDDTIDPALLRTGRIGKRIKVDLPDPAARAKIFDIHKGIAEERAERVLFTPDFDVQQFVDATQGKGLSGDDIKGVIEAALEANFNIERRGGTPELITTEGFLEVVRSYKPPQKVKGSLGLEYGKTGQAQL